MDLVKIIGTVLAFLAGAFHVENNPIAPGSSMSYTDASFGTAGVDYTHFLITGCEISDSLNNSYGKMEDCLPYKMNPKSVPSSEFTHAMSLNSPRDYLKPGSSHRNSTSYLIESLILMDPNDQYVEEKLIEIVNACPYMQLSSGSADRSIRTSSERGVSPEIEAIEKKIIKTSQAASILKNHAKSLHASITDFTSKEDLTKEVFTQDDINRTLDEISRAASFFQDSLAKNMEEIESALLLQTYAFRSPELLRSLAKYASLSSVAIKDALSISAEDRQAFHMLTVAMSVMQNNLKYMQHTHRKTSGVLRDLMHRMGIFSSAEKRIGELEEYYQSAQSALLEIDPITDIMFNKCRKISSAIKGDMLPNVYRTYLLLFAEYSRLFDYYLKSLEAYRTTPVESSFSTSRYRVLKYKISIESLARLLMYLKEEEQAYLKITERIPLKALPKLANILYETRSSRALESTANPSSVSKCLDTWKKNYSKDTYFSEIEDIPGISFSFASLKDKERDVLIQIINNVISMIRTVLKEGAESQEVLLDNLDYALNGLKKMAEEARTCPVKTIKDPRNRKYSSVYLPELSYRIIYILQTELLHLNKGTRIVDSEWQSASNKKAQAEVDALEKKLADLQASKKKLLSQLSVLSTNHTEALSAQKKTEEAQVQAYQKSLDTYAQLEKDKEAVEKKISILKTQEAALSTIDKIETEMKGLNTTLTATVQKAKQAAMQLEDTKNMQISFQIFLKVYALAQNYTGTEEYRAPEAVFLQSFKGLQENPEIMGAISKAAIAYEQDLQESSKKKAESSAANNECQASLKEKTEAYRTIAELSGNVEKTCMAKLKQIQEEAKNKCESMKVHLKEKLADQRNQTEALAQTKASIFNEIESILRSLIQNITESLKPENHTSLALDPSFSPNKTKEQLVFLGQIANNYKDNIKTIAQRIDTSEKNILNCTRSVQQLKKKAEDLNEKAKENKKKIDDEDKKKKKPTYHGLNIDDYSDLD
ncbi:hypothetical protein NECID01_1047 [Nematocida sp. AWRm77]|nr:hypothetical protein NECID01_1047 [Nematocida sp. AWRm77]